MKTPIATTWTGAEFKAKRKLDGHSAEKLAKLLGTSKENVYKWEGTTKPQTKAMIKKVQDYINGVEPKQKAPKPTNGAVHKDDYKEKYYTLLEKYTALLEQTKP